ILKPHKNVENTKRNYTLSSTHRLYHFRQPESTSRAMNASLRAVRKHSVAIHLLFMLPVDGVSFFVVEDCHDLNCVQISQ
ncbi:MAG: hypothetical protein IJR44_01685, partial [Neisseriaceae bacterium]|nr:hypothetical protein [Neisseriaceae bacterium]